MTNPLITKLEHFTRLSPEDKASLDVLLQSRVQMVEAGEDISREGEAPLSMNVIVKGWAFRYKQLADGRRQIVAFFLPGDVCDNNIFILKEMDHSIGALTRVHLVQVTRHGFEDLMMRHPRVTQALWWETLVNMAIQREWTVNLGQRTAFERMAHLFCELFIRMRMVGETQGISFEMPAKQSDLAEATGLSTVHVNRTLQELRSLGLITLKQKTLTIPNLDALMQAAMFSPNYLHLDRDGRHLDSNA
jgi:CRP-like cAMP-binding protein